jgi:hypothetical protein
MAVLACVLPEYSPVNAIKAIIGTLIVFVCIVCGVVAQMHFRQYFRSTAPKRAVRPLPRRGENNTEPVSNVRQRNRP